MKDQEFLMWLHSRLEIVHGENPHVDYMHKLRAIIGATPHNQHTLNCGTYNSLDDLKRGFLRLPYVCSKCRMRCEVIFKDCFNQGGPSDHPVSMCCTAEVTKVVNQ